MTVAIAVRTRLFARLREQAGTDAETVEVRYHGHDGALFRRDYAGLFLDLFPYDLTLVRQGYLSPEEGWDRLTWWLFERS